jgi:hypothetical protein
MCAVKPRWVPWELPPPAGQLRQHPKTTRSLHHTFSCERKTKSLHSQRLRLSRAALCLVALPLASWPSPSLSPIGVRKKASRPLAPSPDLASLLPPPCYSTTARSLRHLRVARPLSTLRRRAAGLAPSTRSSPRAPTSMRLTMRCLRRMPPSRHRTRASGAAHTWLCRRVIAPSTRRPPMCACRGAPPPAPKHAHHTSLCRRVCPIHTQSTHAPKHAHLHAPLPPGQAGTATAHCHCHCMRRKDFSLRRKKRGGSVSSRSLLSAMRFA